MADRAQRSRRISGLPRAEFTRRRKQLLKMLGDGAIAIVPSARERYRNSDAAYPFRQDSDFLYLSGFNEPDSVLVLVPGREHGECVLFCPERDPERELWDGPRWGPERAVQEFGFDDAFPISDLDDILPGMIEGRERICYTLGRDRDFDAQVLAWVQRLRRAVQSGAKPPEEFVSLNHLLHDLRLYKSAGEISLMRDAIAVSVEAHERAMGVTRPGRCESHVHASLVETFYRHQCEPAYEPIVGAGPNACVLHYRGRSNALRRGELLLVDAGAERHGYAADISRTWPIDGRFSSEQLSIYEIVLDAQRAAIEAVKPGKSWIEPHEAAVREISKGLARIGLLKGSQATILRQEQYKRYFMHKTGHWLGLDVHDVGDYRMAEAWRELEPGMVLTIEPGIYISPNEKRVDPRWRGIGVRIEDDVLVTPAGCEVLSQALVKEAREVQARVGAGAA